MRKCLNLIVFVSFCIPTLQAATVKINENYLLKLANKGSPRLDEIQAAFMQVKVRENERNEGYAPELFGQAAYSETNERALIQFQPIFSPVKQVQLGVRQNLSLGITSSAQIVTDQRSSASSPFAGTFDNATTTTLSFSVQMDLWKDLFGRLSKAQLNSVKFDSERARIEKDIQTKSFQLSLRRIYWALVANQEALTLSEELLKTSQRQAAETQERFKNAVAEADEVARYQAQVASRKGTLLYLEYQKETYLKQLRTLLPELSSSEVRLDKYDLGKTMEEVIACTATIASQKTVPYGFTRYDEVIELMRKIRSENNTLNSRYAGPDVKLFGTVKATGISSKAAGTNAYRGSVGGSFEDIESTNRTGYEVGLQFTLPLGSAKESTQKSKEIYDDKRLLAAINSTDAQVVNTHTQLVRSISLLNDVIKSQRTTSRELGKRLVGMRKKYVQARVSVNDLIMDQDAYLNSELTTLDTQLQILNTIFDYLVVYTETPCEFNRN